MDFTVTNQYLKLVNKTVAPEDVTQSLRGYSKYISQSELEKHFSAPMVLIGMYIATASLVCILAMVADLLHGLHSRKLWFPCRYFRVNAAFLTVIAVAMKLPVDLTGSMMGAVDKVAKLGSMAFMCTMMANLLPYLATMGSNELLSNITALCVLVITLVVNVCIQIQTGVLCTISDFDPSGSYHNNPAWSPQIYSETLFNVVACIYVIFLGVLLLVHVCTCLAILGTKKVIESKYQEGHDRASKEIQPSPGELLTVEKLQKHVTNHWIMAGSGSPQFVTACLHTTSVSGVICFLVPILHNFTMSVFIDPNFTKDVVSYSSWSMMLDFCDSDNNAWFCDSDYGRSMMVILLVQYIGVMVGTIAPLSRCFSTLSFKVSPEIISNHFKVLKVESYWTQKLNDLKHACIRIPFLRSNLEVVIIDALQMLILNLCIGLQIGVVVVCKVVALIPFLFVICFHCIKWLFKVVFCPLGKKPDENNELRHYVLKLEDEMELGERTLARLLKSVQRLIKKSEKSQPNNLMKLLEKSTRDFQGVKNFDHIDDHDIQSEDCWWLPLVTLTTITVALPEIEKNDVDSLLESVREGLEYITVVEKSLNAKDDHVRFQKVADTLWREIRYEKKWLGKQQDPDFKMKRAGQIVEWFMDNAECIVNSKDSSKDGARGKNDDLIRSSIFASSMYRITKTILLTCHINNDSTVDQQELFNSLASMIADIIAACLTNLPQAITMKCHTVIEEREASVKDAAQLLGKTTQIIKILQDHHEIPNMDPSEMPFLDKWRSFLGNP